MIKFKLEKAEKSISLQILEQSDEIGKFLPFYYRLFGNNIVSIHRDDNPELRMRDSLSVFLRGNIREKNNDVCNLSFDNNVERDKVHDMIIHAFKELSKKWNPND